MKKHNCKKPDERTSVDTRVIDGKVATRVAKWCTNCKWEDIGEWESVCRRRKDTNV